MRGLLLAAALLATPAVAQTGEPDPAVQAGAPPAGCPDGHPTYAITRDVDRWDYLADPACRTDYADPVKHVPLGGGSFAYVGGEFRFLPETFANQGFDSDADDAYVLVRTMLHLGVQVGPHDGGADGRGASARLFAELKSGLAPGLDRQAPPDRDTLDLGQAFAEVGYAWGGPRASSRVALRAGRLELHYGAGRLISAREGPNVRSSYDGALARLALGGGPLAGWTVDAFAVRPNTTRPGVFDNTGTPGASLWGAYASGPVPRVGTLDVYALGYSRDASFFDQGPADETRLTLGARWTRQAGAWTHDVEGGGQLGTARPLAPDGTPGPDADVVAWFVSTSTSVALAELPGAPTLGLYTGFNSGDADPDDPDLQTFRAPFPPGRYFGASAPFGPSNLSGARPSLTVQPTRRAAVSLAAYVFWRTRLSDGVYGVPGNPVRPAIPDGRYAGWGPELIATYAVDAHLSFRAEASALRPGRYVRDSAPDAPSETVTYGALRATYRF